MPNPIVFVLLGIVVVIILIVIANIKIVPQSKAYVIERLGAFSEAWQTGFHVKVPFSSRTQSTRSA